jgi:aspartate aminotransferase
VRSFDERRRYLVEAINALPGVSLMPPKGAFYALIDVRTICERRGIDDIAVCKELLDRQRLALIPGSAFGAPGFVRASYAAPLAQLQQAVPRFAAWLAEQPGTQ